MPNAADEAFNATSITPKAGVIVGFSVLLAGVTGGHAEHHPKDHVYLFAGAMLGLSGVALFARFAATRTTWGHDELSGADRLGWVIASTFCDILITVVGIALAWALCADAGDAGTGLLGSIAFGIVLSAVVGMIASYTLIAARLTAKHCHRRQKQTPKWASLVVSTLDGRWKGPIAATTPVDEQKL